MSPPGRIVARVAIVMIVVASIAWTVVRTRAVLAEAGAPDPSDDRASEAPGRDEQIAAELSALREADQRVRQELLHPEPGGERDEAWAQARAAEIDRLDAAHVQRLSAILDELGGWPAISRFGAYAEQSACVIAVHATTDHAFMARAAALMEPLVPQGEANAECWAQITDRLLVARHTPQRFGTQLRSEEVDGQVRWGIAPVEEPQELLARRAAAGLPEDYAGYLLRMRRDYAVPDDIPPFPDEPSIPGLVRIDLPGTLPAGP